MIGQFSIQASAGQARAGALATAHGLIETPTFVPCATHGSLRGVNLAALSNQLILANAYHLYLRPGIETIEQLGGLHQFMHWDKPIITDSGGFQAFAFGQTPRRNPPEVDEMGPDRGSQPRAQYTPDGIRFRSHIDGAEHFFTPELVVDIQQRLGVDIGTCLDVCTGFPESEVVVARAVSQTNEWARRSIAAWHQPTGPQLQTWSVKPGLPSMLLYGMVQGSIYPEQRRRAVEELAALPFSGFAIGGNMYTFGQSITQLATEKPKMWEVVSFTASLLPAEKPRHLLGVGEPRDLIDGVRAGIDTFDCVMATRIARHGSAWIRRGDSWQFDRVDISAARFTTDRSPLDPTCECFTCTSSYQRGYLRHLLKIEDPLALNLLSLHNVTLLHKLMQAVRRSIIAGTFEKEFPSDS